MYSIQKAVNPKTGEATQVYEAWTGKRRNGFHIVYNGQPIARLDMAWTRAAALHICDTLNRTSTDAPPRPKQLPANSGATAKAENDAVSTAAKREETHPEGS